VLKRKEVAVDWRRLHNEELHNLYASPDIIRVSKSKGVRLVGHVARMGEMHTKFWSENLKGRDHMEDLGVDGNTILELILKN
jgi:hypothetical protein